MRHFFCPPPLSRAATALLAIVLLLTGCATPLTPEQRADRDRVLARLADSAEKDQATAEANVTAFRAPSSDGQTHHRVQPVIRFQPNPVYPFALRKQGVQGLVWVAFVVTSSGDTADVKAVGNSDAPFIEPAIQAVTRWKFTPAMIDGRPVNCRIVVPIGFTLE